ncbi:MAG: hypothetical protein SPJ02_09840 [Parabacteroides sp.]|nr:hypothetical protein [Parabacteroides sp.]
MEDILHELNEWKEQLDRLKESLAKELEDIQQCKADIAQLRTETADKYSSVHYIRDDRKLILSAPEIVIGNVNRHGMLLGNEASVTVRGHLLKLESLDKLEQRAPQIHQIAEYPGIDGEESTLLPEKSEIVQAGRSILVKSLTEAKTICPGFDLTTKPGITLASEGGIAIDASLACKTEKEALDRAIAELETQKGQAQSQLNEIADQISNCFLNLKLAIKQPTLQVTMTDLLTRAAYMDLEELQKEFGLKSEEVYSLLSGYYHQLAVLARINIRLSELKKRKEAVSGREASFKDETTSSRVLIKSETIRLESRDGDNNVRTNDEAGVYVTAPHTILAAQKDDHSSIEQGTIALRAETIDLNTQNTSMTDQEKGEGESKAEGQVNIISKEIRMEAVDEELKEHKPTEKALTAESKIFMRAETIQVDSTDTEGKATGLIDLNAKNVRLKSMDVDKESRKESALAEGSQLQLLADSLYIGSAEDDTKSKWAQVAADKVKLFGTTTAELQQDKDKGLVALDGGKVTVNGDEINLFGTLDSKGQSTFTALTSKHIDTDTMEIKKGWKTPITSEGTPGAASPDSSKQQSQNELKKPSFEGTN